MSHGQLSEELNVCYDPNMFRINVQRELDEESVLLQNALKPLRETVWMHALSIVLLSISGAIIILDPNALYLWLFIGLLLYSYNFLTLLNPSTTIKPRPKELSELRSMGLDEKWLVFRLLAKKKKLAIEIGLTVFMVGNIPLVICFSMIFGLGLTFLIYYAGFTNIIDWNMTFIIVIQTILILGFQIFLYLLKPESQGISHLARTMKGRYDEARIKGWMAMFMFLMIIITTIVVSALLIIGAMLLPNYTMFTLSAKMIEIGQSSFILLALVIAVQFFIIRHFEAHESRLMAIRLIKKRISLIRTDVLVPFDAMMNRNDLSTEQFEAEFFEIRKRFYSIVIYHVVKIDIFGRSPVYLVGPRLKYVLDDKVLNHFHD